MKKFYFVLSLLLAFSFTLAQNQTREVSPTLTPQTKPITPVTEAVWDIQFNYDATVVTAAAGNAGAVYIPTINKYWTSRWASAIMHQWNADGTLDLEFTAPFSGTRGMVFDGQYVYCSINTTTVQVVDPVTRTLVGTIPVVGAPNGARFITYDPDADAGNGAIIVGNWTSPNFNFYVFSMTGTLLRTITSTQSGVYGLAFDKWSNPGTPYLWVWTQGAGAGTPQLIMQMDYTTGTYTGIQHDVITDVGVGQTAAIAGGLFLTDGIVPGKLTLGGMLQGTPDRLFGYEIGDSGPVLGPGPATNPIPLGGATNVPVATAQLTWENPTGTTSNNVYFGTSVGGMISVQNSTPAATSYNIPASTLQYNTTYYWRVNETDGTGTTTGSVWSFTTEQDPNLVSVQVFMEDFETGTTNWTITNDGGTCIWEVLSAPFPNTYTLPATSTGAILAADADECGSSTTTLTTATLNQSFDLTLYTELVSIEFDNDWYHIDAQDEAHVEVSIDGGTTWTGVWDKVGVSVRNTHEIVDVTTLLAGQSNVKIRLRTVQPGYDWWWVIDNLEINGDYITPVELTSFTGISNNNNIELSWSTATETNNQGFEIHRKTTGDFIQVGYVPGFGTTTESKTYSFIDNNVSNETYTYRLKQVDFDGTFAFSSEVEVGFEGPSVFTLEQNYPNPFNPSTKIVFSVPVESKVSLKVFDILGQEVFSQLNQNYNAGSHTITFDGSSINSGVYFYRIDASGYNGQEFSSVKKMILTK